MGSQCIVDVAARSSSDELSSPRGIEPAHYYSYYYHQGYKRAYSIELAYASTVVISDKLGATRLACACRLREGRERIVTRGRR